MTGVVLAGFVVVACAGAKITEKGPRVQASLRCGSSTVSEQTDPETPTKECTVDKTKKAYLFDLSVDTRNGDKDTEGSKELPESFVAKDPTVTITVDGQPIPTPTFTSRDFSYGKSYETPELSIPDTSSGKTITVHVETTDERGLKSNAIDLEMILKPATP